MKRRNFFERLAAVTAAVVVAPQALAEADKSAREFHKATKEVSKTFSAGDLWYDTQSDTLYIALFTTEPQTMEVYTEGAASPNHIHVAGIMKEADYKGYRRVQVGRTEAQWSVVDNKATNKEPIIFPQCSRGYNKITHIGVCLEEDSDPVIVMIIPGVMQTTLSAELHIDAGSLTVEIE